MATAASSMPIPQPPRTPTPPPDEPRSDPSVNDVEQRFEPLAEPFEETSGARSLSPSRANFAYQPSSYDPNTRSISPVRSTHLMAPTIPPPSPSTGTMHTPSALSTDRGRRPPSIHDSSERRFSSYSIDGGPGAGSPSRGSFSLNSNGGFSFQPQSLAKSPVLSKSVRIPRKRPSPINVGYLPSCSSQMLPSPIRASSRRRSSPVYPDTSPLPSPNPDFDTDSFQNIGQRRGHKYKHSSVSHQIFLEPPQRAPLALPNSLPIPTFAECRASMTTDQRLRFWWSICHMLVAAYTAWNAHSSAAMEALSHLIFYDSLGALLCVAVEVLGNFDVWSRSSIRHPFGLQRMEVIAGFALSVLLVFMGFDLVSHNAKHALEGLGDHVPHRGHSHERVSAGTVDVTAIVAFGSTMISAVGLKNHARIGKAMRFAAMENLPSVLSNPSHFLTLSCSATLLVLPLLSLHAYEWIDKVLSLSIAGAMLFLGGHLGKNVGQMLLMSYSGKSVNEVIREIEGEPSVSKVEEAKFWQAHYGVGMANLRLRVSGSEETLLRLREKLTSLIRNRLSGGYGRGGQKWEVSVQFKQDHHGVGHGHHHGHHHHQHGSITT